MLTPPIFFRHAKHNFRKRILPPLPSHLELLHQATRNHNHKGQRGGLLLQGPQHPAQEVHQGVRGPRRLRPLPRHRQPAQALPRRRPRRTRLREAGRPHPLQLPRRLRPGRPSATPDDPGPLPTDLDFRVDLHADRELRPPAVHPADPEEERASLPGALGAADAGVDQADLGHRPPHEGFRRTLRSEATAGPAQSQQESLRECGAC